MDTGPSGPNGEIVQIIVDPGSKYQSVTAQSQHLSSVENLVMEKALGQEPAREIALLLVPISSEIILIMICHNL